MARSGAFIGMSERYGTPLAIVYPADGQFHQFDPAIENLEGIDDAKRAEIQAQVEELYASLLLGRDLD